MKILFAFSGKQLTNSQNLFEYTLNSMSTNDKINETTYFEKQTRLDLMREFFL